MFRSVFLAAFLIATSLGAADLNQIIGTESGDVIVGTRFGDNIKAGGGNDQINGGGGPDRIHAGNGSDFAHGGPGNDEIFLDAGDDEAYPGPGNDVIWTVGNQPGHTDRIDLNDGQNDRNVVYVGPHGTVIVENVDFFRDHFILTPDKLQWDVIWLKTERVGNGWGIERVVFEGPGGVRLDLRFSDSYGEPFGNPIYTKEPSLTGDEAMFWLQMYIQGDDRGPGSAPRGWDILVL